MHYPIQRASAQAAWITGAAVQQPPKSPVHEDEDNAWLHAAAQLFAVSDKLRSIYECTEFRGEEAGEERRAGRYSRRRDWCHHLYRLDTGEDQPLSSLAHRTRRVHQAIARVLLAPAETLHGTTRARAATTSAGAFLSVQPSVPSVDHSSSSRVQAQAAEVEGAAIEQAPRYPEEERGNSTDPHADAQLFAVNDGRRSFSERADLRWQEVHEHSRADWRGWYGCIWTSDVRSSVSGTLPH
ncbi:hypothetical protein V5799_019695 [Amblyomma americanum]|uniref:Uncharacterized protein n=1 Tax=Amblyomma americanum TaxID=6943 RepID=A0AAQ4EVR9_AMBAM